MLNKIDIGKMQQKLTNFSRRTNIFRTPYGICFVRQRLYNFRKIHYTSSYVTHVKVK